MKNVSKLTLLLMAALVASSSTVQPIGFSDVSNFIKKHKKELLAFSVLAIAYTALGIYVYNDTLKQIKKRNELRRLMHNYHVLGKMLEELTQEQKQEEALKEQEFAAKELELAQLEKQNFQQT